MESVKKCYFTTLEKLHGCCFLYNTWHPLWTLPLYVQSESVPNLYVLFYRLSDFLQVHSTITNKIQTKQITIQCWISSLHFWDFLSKRQMDHPQISFYKKKSAFYSFAQNISEKNEKGSLSKYCKISWDEILLLHF